MAIENTLRWIILGSIFALPFIAFLVTQSLFFPFITGKNFAFRILVEIMAGGYLALALLNMRYRPRRSWLLGAFAIFVVVVALADAFGVYPFKSFWSNYERMDGWVTLAHLFTYFVVASVVLHAENMWRWYLRTSLFASVLMSLYSLLQLFGIASLTTGFSSLSRLDGRFGNPIYLAVYMLFNIGIAALLWRQEWSEGSPGRRRTVSFAYGSVIVLDTIVLFLTGTRGAMLGLMVGVILAASLLVFSSDVSRRVSRIAVSIIVGILAFSGIFFLIRGQEWVNKVPILNRLATISLSDGTTQARFMNWGMAWQGVKERPILGWGQENYAIVFDKYYNPRMYAQEQWFDRVHNVIFDWLVAAGFAGLISYLSLFAAALWALWKRGVFDGFERSILAGLLAAYFFHNLFVFDNVMSYILFTTVLAYIASRAASNNPALPLPAVPRKYILVVVALALFLVWGVAWVVNARPLAANRALLQGLAPHQEGLGKNLEYFKQSIAYGTYGMQEAREQLTQGATQISQADSVPVDIKRAFFETAAHEMAAQADLSALDARFPLFFGALLDAYGDLQNGANALKRAHELSPGKQSILFELGANALARGTGEEALSYFKQAYDLAPEYIDARLSYAAVAIRLKKDALAEELLAPIVASGDAADPRIAAAYVVRGRYDKIAEIWEKRVAARPSDASAYFTLAAAYYGAGNKSKAVEVLEKAGTLSAETKTQADALIKEIRQGTAKLN